MINTGKSGSGYSVKAMERGRPPKFKTPEEMQQAVDAYFAQCLADGDVATVTGLAFSLNLTRQGLIEYSEKLAFSDTVKRAKLRVEMAIEQRLLTGGSPAGAIFNLKNNFGWKDKSEQEITGKDGGPIETKTKTLVVVGVGNTDQNS